MLEPFNTELQAGHIRVFGGSNWRTERIAEANTYAAEHGLVGFSVSSPNLSLARPKEPMWVGCISASVLPRCDRFNPIPATLIRTVSIPASIISSRSSD